MTGRQGKQNALVYLHIMNAATFPSPSASTASASTIMSRASEDVLSQRKILNKTGITRASEDIIKKRKIVKVLAWVQFLEHTKNDTLYRALSLLGRMRERPWYIDNEQDIKSFDSNPFRWIEA